MSFVDVLIDISYVLYKLLAFASSI